MKYEPTSEVCAYINSLQTVSTDELKFFWITYVNTAGELWMEYE